MAKRVKTSFEVEHHHGWVNTEGKLPYEHIRETHEFLTDDNHDHKDNGESITILRNENSTPFHPLTPSWARDSKVWFSNRYRTVVGTQLTELERGGE